MSTKGKTSKAPINQKKAVNKTTCNPCSSSGNGSKSSTVVKQAAKPAPKPPSKSIQFSYYAPDARQVCLAGDFNNWDINSCNLTKTNTGEWTASLQLKPGVYDYRFFVDGEWREDPKSSERVPNAFGSQNDRIVVK
jgi:1,4-alpha-glucan branching enzyme